ncbi:MAG: ABC transporter transmembrane domain-containing protein [Pseudomonadota bacterium]
MTFEAPQSSKSGREETAEDGYKRANRKVAIKPLLALSPYLRAQMPVLIIAGVALIISAGAMLAVPMAVRRIVDFGFSAQHSELIDSYFMMLMVIGLVLACASSTRAYTVNWLGERVVADLRRDVFRHLTKLGPAFFNTNHSGELMSRLTADTTQIKTAAGSALSQTLRNTIMLIGAVAMMFVTSIELSLMVLLAIPAIVLPLMMYGRVVRRLSRVAQDTLAESSAFAAENLAAVSTLQAFTNERSVAARFADAVETSMAAATSRLQARAGLTAMAIALVTVSIVGVLWYGASLVVAEQISAGRLSQFVLYAVFAAGALAELAEVMGEVQQASGAAERLGELLAAVPPIQSPKTPVPLPHPFQGRVRVDAVSFTYPTGDPATRPALHDVSFTAEPGKLTALVGPSGSGKSTIFNLILRFYDPGSGHVTLDDVSVARLDLADLRKQIAFVPQDVALFADTIAENIRYGAPDASRADIEQAAMAAQAHDFIAELASGYDTNVGERGVTLSGGQRQRIAIARAILRDAPILLLDEATSALDADSEVAIQRALEQLMIGRTTIVIAHRLATIQKADKIIVLDHGRVVEHGTHASLSGAGGLYSRLAELQFTSPLQAAE